MKKLTILSVLLFVLLLSSKMYAADTKLTALDALAAVADGDLLYIVDVTGNTFHKITVLNLFDTIDTFAELNTITADKTLVNEEDAATWDALGTFGLGLTITTGDPFTFGVNRIDNGSDLLDGEMIGADTIDDDSIDFADVTGVDLTLTDCGAITSTGTITATVGFDIVGAADIDYGSADVTDHTFVTDGTGTAEVVFPAGSIDGTEILDDTIDSADYAAGSIDAEHLAADIIDETKIADNGIDSEHYNDGSIDLVHLAAGVYAKDLVTTSPITGAADNIFVGADSDVTIAIGDADDDGATKGAASFDNTDFDAVAGNVTINDDGHAHTSTSISGLDVSADINLTAGDALTLTDDDIDFDGGASPGGELGNTWASPTIDDSVAVTSWNLTTPTLTTSATVSDAFTIGLGAGKGLIQFDDEATDYISLMNANVGIGTDSPNAPLEVKGAKPGVVGGHQSGVLQVTGSGATQYYCSVITGHNSFNGNTQLWYLGSTTSAEHDDIAFINRQNAAMHFYTNNASRMIIDAAGDVGIGTIIPAEKLTVGNAAISAGTIAILEDTDDGANYASFTVPALAANTVYTLPPDDGDNTEVLQTDGSGALTWVANAGGSTAWNDIVDPDNSGLTTITFDNAELSLLTGDNDAAASFITIQNTDADHTGGNLYLLDLDYSADDGDLDADFIKCQDSGGVVFTVQENGRAEMSGQLHVNNQSNFAGTMVIDDDSGDSPMMQFIDEDENYLGIQKDDDGQGSIVNSEGAIYIKPSADFDDYLSISTAAGVVTIETVANDDGDLVITAGGGDISTGSTFEAATITEGAIAVHNNDQMDASSELAAIIDDETGTGLIVFGTGPSFTDNIDITELIDTSNLGPNVLFNRKRDGDPTDDVSSGDYLAELTFRGYHTDGYDFGAQILAIVDNTPGNGDMPGRLEFKTSSDASASPTLRMTIDSAGNTEIGFDAAAYLRITTADGGITTISQISDGTDEIKFGDGGDLISVDSGNWDVSNAGAFTGLTGITSTGTVDLSGATVTMPKRTKNDDRFYTFNLFNPNSLYDTDTQVFFEPNLPANITITEVQISCDADPATELDIDLKWADAMIGLANATLIEPIDTTNGTTDIDSGFDDATVAAGKCMYVEFAADPDSNITQAIVKIRYDFD